MAIYHTKSIGDSGSLLIVDRTDDPDLMMIELGIMSSVEVSVPQLPWTYALDGVKAPLRSFDFQPNTDWQGLAGIHSGGASEVTLYLEETGTTELGGPTDFTVTLYNASSEVEPGETPAVTHVKVGDVYKRAVAYVNDNGVWKVAQPYVKTPTGWVKSV